MTTKEIEYPDAPCGYVTMYNYKEPFMPFKDPVSREGYGYEGVLVFDGETDKVQCHLCGKWFHALGNHLHREHAMNAAYYKDLTGLSQTTALIGEKYRAKLIERGQNRFNNLIPGGKKTQEQKDKISATLRNWNREKQNRYGTCPLQLIDRLQRKAQELGRCPKTREITFGEAIDKVYGSFGKACEIAGLTPLKPGQTLRKKKVYEKEFFVNHIRPFWIENKKFPTYKQFCAMFPKNTTVIRSAYLKLKKEIHTEVLFGEKVYQKTGIPMKHTPELLIRTLQEFERVNNRKPSISDCKRGLLPHASTFYYHFGSLKKAIELI